MYGSSPLHSAARNQSLDMSRLLIENGAEVDARDENGTTPLASIEERLQHSRMGIDLFAEAEVTRTLNSASLVNPLAVARLLIEHGANIDSKDDLGDTTLHNAESLEMASFLIDSGADIEAKNTLDETPLHSAVRNEDKHPFVFDHAGRFIIYGGFLGAVIGMITTTIFLDDAVAGVIAGAVVGAVFGALLYFSDHHHPLH